MILWLNGALCDAAEARIDPADRGFTLGDGVFETIRVAGGVAAHLPAHLARLRAGAALLSIAVAADDATLGEAIADTVRANGLENAAVRLTLSRGPAPRGVLPAGPLRPTLLIAAGPLPPPLSPACASVSQTTRRNEFSPLSRIKSLNYLDSILARQEAARRGADEVLLRNTRGVLAEASAANLFVLRAGALATPPISDGALPGVMRGILLARCDGVERSLDVADLRAADLVFLSSSLGLRMVAALDGQPLRQDTAALRAIATRAGLSA